ncbi:MAG TPA: DUF1538 domain-containing protein, partial [Rubrobacter sp.]|nr:DUF1538 domain-containing protein [Rubrobacter sp.]
SVAPVIGILLVFQFLVLRRPLEDWREIAVGLALTVVGLVIFLKGLEIGLTPLGEAASETLARRGSLPLIVLFGVSLGYGATLAEPALRILARRTEELTGGALGSTLFVQTVAVGVALGLAVGSARIVLGIETTPFFIPALALALVLTFFAPERYTGARLRRRPRHHGAGHRAPRRGAGKRAGAGPRPRRRTDLRLRTGGFCGFGAHTVRAGVGYCSRGPCGELGDAGLQAGHRHTAEGRGRQGDGRGAQSRGRGWDDTPGARNRRARGPALLGDLSELGT